MIFGIEDDTITALTNVGLLAVTLVFSAVAAIQQYRNFNPTPAVEADLIERSSNSPSKYLIRVRNLGRRPFQVGALTFPSDFKWKLSADGADWSRRMSIGPISIDPGTHWETTVLIDKGGHDWVELGVEWYRHGTAGTPKYAEVAIRR